MQPATGAMRQFRPRRVLLAVLALLMFVPVCPPAAAELSAAIEWPFTDDMVAGNVNITGSAQGAQSVEMSMDGGCWTLAQGTSKWFHIWNTSGLSGTHTILARAVSGSNRSGASSIQVSVNNVPPTLIELTLDLSATQVYTCETLVVSGLAKYDTGVRLGENRVEVSMNNESYNSSTDKRGFYTLSLKAAATPGQYNVRAYTAASGLSANSNVNVDVRMKDPPDLSIVPADMFFSPEQPYGGQEVTISAIVRNLGSGTGAVKVRFSTPAATETDVFLNVTVSWNATVRWTLPSGSHNISVKLLDVTPYDSNVSNNEAIKSLRVFARPDPAILDVVFSNSRPTVGRNVTIQARVRNGGEKEAACTVRFYDGTPSAATQLGQVQSTVSANTTKMVFLEWNATLLGEHTIYARITDVYPQEASDLNNEGHRSLIVSKRTDPPSPPGTVPGFELIVFTGAAFMAAILRLRSRSK